MKKILFLTEKPSVCKTIFAKMKENKDPFYTENEIYVAFCNWATAPTYDYPTNIKYKDYPKTNPLKLKWNEKYEFWAQQDYIKTHKNVKEIKNKEEFIQDFDCLLIATDPDAMGAFYAQSTLEYVYGKNYENRFKKIYYTRFKEASKIYEELFLNQEENKEHFYDLAQAGEFKKWFQYNFNFNSAIFFTEILNHLEIKSDIKISKYMLLIMHLLYNQSYTHHLGGAYEELNKNGIKEVNIFYAFQKYKGSKKFNSKDDYGAIGSPVTIATLMQNLYNLGLLSYDKKNYKVKSTKLGREFYNLLNKRTFDIDMTYRINSWVRDVISKKDLTITAENYIKNFFTAQKRKNNKVLRK